MFTDDIDGLPGSFTIGSPEQTSDQNPDPTADEVSRVLRLLGLPELRLDVFDEEESLKILSAIQKYSSYGNDEFTCFLALPKVIYKAHQAALAAERDLFDRFSELEDAENKLNSHPEELNYDDDDSPEKPCQEARGERFKQYLSTLDSLTLAMREAHVCAASEREVRADSTLQYLETWLKILAPSSVGNVVHEDLHEAKDKYIARAVAFAEACWLRDTYPRYEEGWDDGLVWDFLRDGRTALDLLISRGAIVLSSGTGAVEERECIA